MLKNPLELIGLDEQHTKVYLSMLTMGNTTVQEIALATGLKRPTVYTYLDNLITNGLVSRVQIDKKTYFKATHLDTVTHKVENAYKKYKEDLPLLLQIASGVQGKPRIEILEGEQGILQAYEDMSTAKNFRIWSDLGKVHKFFNTHFQIIADNIRKREITSREILAPSKENIKSSKHFAHLAGPTYSVRVSPLDGIMNDSIIYDDTVTLFRIHDFNMYVVRIKDSTIASTLSTLFDLAWKSSVTIKEFDSRKGNTKSLD